MKHLSNFIFLINPPNLTDTCFEMIMSNVKDCDLTSVRVDTTLDNMVGRVFGVPKSMYEAAGG